MLKAIFNWFTGKPAPEAEAPRVPETVAPYKVETPAPIAPVAAPEPAKCGCGRSTSGYCVGLHKLTAEEWAGHADNPNRVVATKAKAKPRAVAKPKEEKKPAVVAMKAPRKPRAKKA